MRGRLGLLAVFVIAGFMFGLVDEHLPAPREVGVFWVGNLSSLWIVLPFLAGWTQCSPIWAAVAGAMTAEAAIVGFYGFLEPSFRLPIGFVAPWLVIAALIGPSYGLLGRAWGRSRSLPAGLAAGLPFILEPWLWTLRLGYVPHPTPIWAIETALGLLLLAWTAATWNTRRTHPTAS